MEKDKERTQRFLEYYSFWLYEYTQRNKLYKKKVDYLDFLSEKYPSFEKESKILLKSISDLVSQSLVNKSYLSDDPLKEIEKLLKGDDFNTKNKKIIDIAEEVMRIDEELGFPLLSNVAENIKSISSDEILNLVIEHGVVSKGAMVEYNRDRLYSSINYDYKKLHPSKTNSQKERFIKLSIDTDCSLDVIFAEIVSAYYNKKVQRMLLDKFNKINSGLSPEESTYSEYDVLKMLSKKDLLHMGMNNRSRDRLVQYKIMEKIKGNGRGFDLDDTPRAIGLWLWDYITNKYGESKPPHKAYAEARRVFKEKFDYVKLGYQETESGTYRNWYHRTAACIEACDVLSFKGDGRKKKTEA